LALTCRFALTGLVNSINSHGNRDQVKNKGARLMKNISQYGNLDLEFILYIYYKQAVKRSY